MSWEAAGAIGEIVGAAAVVVSLVYLASQIRTQNREARAASVHQVMHEYAEAISRLHDPEMAEIWVRAHEDFDSLSPPQRLRFIIYLMVAVRSFEDAYFQWREGRLEDDVWRALLAPLRDVKSTEAFGRFWELRRHQVRPEFADYLDGLEDGEYSF
ncbi:MAG: hypothetical protein QNK05_25935 [Myxococcota bacterium]|nr:hypothetical protein [Myxococcota bacterium]